MKAKIALLLGAGVGYVLGTRDGRARYEQMKATAGDLWNDPRVQQVKDTAQGAVQNAVHGDSSGSSSGEPPSARRPGEPTGGAKPATSGTSS